MDDRIDATPKVRNVTLEISAKALVGGRASASARSESPRSVAAAYAAARAALRQWRPLADRASQVSVLLWTSDGSELLDWSGDFADTFEWACWCGCANHHPRPENPTPRQRRNVHQFPVRVFPGEIAAPLPYAWLRDAVAAIRAAARDELGREIRVGTTFDNGPEFAISDFKYRRHREVMLGETIFPGSFLVCSASLHADARRYAAFPDGIPEGLSVGAFLGAQYRAFARDFGIDYIWLSNGMGFGLETWGVSGALFDKSAFHPERIPEASARMLGFWRDFFAAAPDAVVETRGSNFSAGVEIATDAAPLGVLYAKGRIEPPVNSPWAALNFNTGLELAAWMSHVAELPKGRGFPFRFYPHDPWFLNSPWLDRYAREPWDIYAPLSVCRVRADGSVQTPDSVALLSVDDTRGRMPDEVPRDVAPHILRALATAPDRPGPLVWVYPFGEYAAAVSCKAPCSLPRIFNEDFFLGEALQGGLPLNTVVSTANWRAWAGMPRTARHDAGHPVDGFAASCGRRGSNESREAPIFVLPVAALLSSENLAALEAWEALGARFLVYGSLAVAPEALLSRLGLALAAPLAGEFAVSCAPARLCAGLVGDAFAAGSLASRIYAAPALDGGGLCEVAAETARTEPGSPVAAAYAISPSGERRVIASVNGAFAFVRSITPCDDTSRPHPSQFDYAPPTQVFPVERLMRHVLGAAFGWSILADAPSPATLLPRANVSRHDNAFVFHVFTPDTTAALRVRTPYGAPLLAEHETTLRGGEAVWRTGKSWRRECRLFVDGQTDGIVQVKTSIALHAGFEGRLRIRGLAAATIRFFPPPDFLKTVELAPSFNDWDFLQEPVAPEWENTPDGHCAIWRNVSGDIFLAW